MRPPLLVIAGPNGAGKTTVTERLRRERWSEGVEYAEWTDARREELLARREGIAFETVFSTATKVDFLSRAKAAGYFVRVFFIGTSDPRINAARVANRVMDGGHTVPIEKIVSRYARSLANLSPAIQLADRVYVYDNSVEDVEATLCLRTTEGAIRKVYSALPAWIVDATATFPNHPDLVDLRAAGE